MLGIWSRFLGFTPQVRSDDLDYPRSERPRTREYRSGTAEGRCRAALELLAHVRPSLPPDMAALADDLTAVLNGEGS